MTTMITFDPHINLRKPFINISANTIIIIDLYLKHIISNKMIIYKRFETIDFLINLLDKYQNLFIDQD